MIPLVLAQEAAAQIGKGELTGGWDYVWSAYSVAWTGMVLYSLSLWLRLRGQQVKEGAK